MAGTSSYPEHRSSWTVGRTLAVVLGALLTLGGIGMVPVGGAALWFDEIDRDSNGFVMSDSYRYTTATYALTTEPDAFRLDGPNWVMSGTLGDVRIEARSDTVLFIGIARTDDVTSYLGNVERTTVSGVGGQVRYQHHAGSAPGALPSVQTFWDASATGTGTQVLHWSVRNGDWTVVVMNADAGRSVVADIRVGATIPWLDDAAWWLLGGGIVLIVLGGVMILAAARAPRPHSERS